MDDVTRPEVVGLLVLLVFFAIMWFVERRRAAEDRAWKWATNIRILVALLLYGGLVYAC